jgi:hypothetical protein
VVWSASFQVRAVQRLMGDGLNSVVFQWTTAGQRWSIRRKEWTESSKGVIVKVRNSGGGSAVP